MAKEKRKKLARAIAEELRETHNQADLLDGAVAELLGVNRTEVRCVDLLERHGPMTAGELAAASGLTTGAITAVLDRMEKSGYALRTRDTADRRRVLVELTSTARELGKEIYGPLVQDHGERAKRYTTEELDLVLDFVKRGKQIEAEHLERIRARTAEQHEQSRR